MFKHTSPSAMFSGPFVPNWIMSQWGISAGAKLTYACLAEVSDMEGFASPSRAELAERLKEPARQVRRFLDELERGGLIECHGVGDGGSNVYSFNAPD